MTFTSLLMGWWESGGLNYEVKLCKDGGGMLYTDNALTVYGVRDGRQLREASNGNAYALTIINY